jgi:hypothetical protein
MLAREQRARRRREARQVREVDEMRSKLSSLSHSAARMVRRREAWGDKQQSKATGDSSRSRKTAKILKVKEQADKKLDALLAQVDEAIEREAWRHKQVAPPPPPSLPPHQPPPSLPL